MDFDLTEQQKELRKVLRDFVARDVRPAALDYERSGRYPEDMITQMKGLGLFGLTVPEEYGGLDLDGVTLAIVFEELTRGWLGAAGMLGTHSVSCSMIARYGTASQRQKLLPDLATGARRTGLALTEPEVGSDLQGISTIARRVGGSYEVTGRKMWITNARHSDPLPVLVKTDPDANPPHKGMSVLLVDANSPGFSVSRDIGKLGYNGPETCEVILDNVRVPREHLLGETEGHGLQQVLSSLEIGRINVAARAVGLAQAALDLALEYSANRWAFGQPIGEFQAIQFKLADLATEVQAARLLTWWAAARTLTGERSDVASGMAKVFASEVALRAASESMRVHGAYGYSTEYEVERLYRDAPLFVIGEGTNEILRAIIASGLTSGSTS